MSANLVSRGIGLAAMIACAGPAWSGPAGGHGVMMPPPGVSHGGGSARAGGFYGATGGFRRTGGYHALPPIAGTIHLRDGQAFVTPYGHTNTGVGGAVFYHAGVYTVGRRQTLGPAPHWAGYGETHFGASGRKRSTGYGRVLIGRERIRDRVAYRDRLRLAEFGRSGALGYGGSIYGGYGGTGYGTGGVDGDDVGSIPAAGTFDVTGTSASAGTYPGPGVYESELAASGFTYRSETPLAARLAEAPLAPSPYSGFDAGNGYADAASGEAGPGFRPREAHVSDRGGGCTCDRTAQTTPTVYRYGIGTAY